MLFAVLERKRPIFAVAKGVKKFNFYLAMCFFIMYNRRIKGETMNTLKQILSNEIALKLGHAPSADEFSTIMNHVYLRLDEWDIVDDKITLVDISLAIVDYVADCFVKCAYSGGYYLPNELTTASDGACVAPENLARYEQDLAEERDNKKELLDRWHGLY